MRLFLFNTLQNQLLAFVTFAVFLQWVLPKATYLEQFVSYQSSTVNSAQVMFQSGTFFTTGAYLATELFIINDWFFQFWCIAKGNI